MDRVPAEYKLYIRYAKMCSMVEPAAESELSFEAALDRLEELVRSLEDGDLPLDDALQAFEEGVRLSRFCHGKLQAAERRIEILLQDEDGEITPRPFLAEPGRAAEPGREDD
jgi:exodeoxyribonuclease VII small subunit